MSRTASPTSGRRARPCRPAAPAVVFAAVVLASCPATPAPPRGPSVVLIAIDTLRADRLGCQGGARDLTPRLDALAAGGVRFAQAFAHAPWTLPSFASLFTSLPPEAHGAGGNVREGWRGLEEQHATLAEQFQAAGWSTAAVVNVDFLTEPFGSVQGFDEVDARAYADNERVRRAAPTTDAALAWLDRRPSAADGRPFLLLVHYFDPHAEYDPPPEWRARFALEADRDTRAFRFGTREHVVLHRSGRMPLEAAQLARAKALYDAEVAYTDFEIGRLLDGLSARGLDRDTIVVLTSDHGEEFGDHGSWEHGHTLYDELLHVPLIVRAPGLAPRVVAEPVGLADVAPTLCSLAGVAPAPAFAGRDLAPALRGGTWPGLDGLGAFGSFWSAPLASWRAGCWKSVRGPGRTELYDWCADPRERDDRALRDPGPAQALDAARSAHLRALGIDAPRAGPLVDPGAAATGRLHGQGYTGGLRDEPR